MDESSIFISLGDGFEAHAGRFLFHRPTCAVIFSDVHLGVEGTLRRQGIDFPDMNLVQLMGKCRGIVALMRATLAAAGQQKGRLIIAGDFLDDRAERSEAAAAWDQARKLLELFCAEGGVAEITLVPGNHDPGLTRLQGELPQCATIRSWTEVGGYAVIHGDGALERLPGVGEAAVKGFIAGHLHPVVVLGDRVRSAKMPVFLRCGVNGGKKLLVMPTFSQMPIGTNVAVARYWFLPFARPIERDIEVFGVVEPMGQDGRVLNYGTLASLREGMVLAGGG